MPRRHHLAVLSLFALVSVALGAGACTTEAGVRRAIEAGRGCAYSSDCIDVGSLCPISCNIVVHRAHAERVRKAIARYPERCDFDCQVPGPISCEAGRCERLPPGYEPFPDRGPVAVFEGGRPLDPEEAEARFRQVKLAYVRAYQAGDKVGAERELRRGLDLFIDPEDVRHQFLAERLRKLEASR